MLCTKRPLNISLRHSSTYEPLVTDSSLIVTLETPLEKVTSPTLARVYDSSCSESNENDASGSSDWDALSDNSTDEHDSHSTTLAAAYLPHFHQKKNERLTIESFSCVMPDEGTSVSASVSYRSVEEERQSNERHTRKNTEQLFREYSLFYPHLNLQSLLFSSIHPFTSNDYRDDAMYSDDYTDSTIEDTTAESSGHVNIDWYNTDSVARFSKLMSKLLLTASYGIREDELYLMFTSPPPAYIVMHLRFGVLSALCHVHVDRFGRRCYYHHQHQQQHTSDTSMTLIHEENLAAFLDDDSDEDSDEDDDNDTPIHNQMYSPVAVDVDEVVRSSFKQHPLALPPGKHPERRISNMIAHIKTTHNGDPYIHRASYKRRQRRRKVPTRPLPARPKPALSDATKRKLTARKKRTLAAQFRAVNLSDIVVHDRELKLTTNNYLIAKGITLFFDVMFGDTDTVCMVCGADKEPELSYWLKTDGDFIRKSHNVGMYNKTVCVYRACHHMKAKQPVLTQQQFESHVRQLCTQHKNKSVKFIGDALDETFGFGVHFARSTLNRCDYDVYCRFSDHYECSFTLPSGAHIVAWRR